MNLLTTLTPEEKDCIRCTASTKRYWHKLTPGLVSALIKINKAVNLKRENDIRIDRLPADLKLTHEERCNWQKLRLHGLVARVKFMGEVKRGRWCMTRKGYKFLSGKPIAERVLSFRNAVQGHSPEEVTISQVARSSPYFESIDDIKFEYPEPQEEGETVIERTPIVPRRKRLKKGQTPCPKCGEALVNRMDSKIEGDKAIVEKWRECPGCTYTERKT